jgi:hypothetical protein
MEFYRLDYSLSIFIPECNLKPESKPREEISKEAGN